MRSRSSRTRPRVPVTEGDLGRAVVARLVSEGWDVYEEVLYQGWVADAVARRDGRLWVVEVKRALSFDVVAQARRWRPHAHRVSVAVPAVRVADEGRALAREVLEERGLGLVEVQVGTVVGEHRGEPVWFAWERLAPAPEADPVPGLEAALRPEQKRMARAGAAGGGHWTPFKGTAAALARLVAARPGVSLGDAVGAISHHYRTRRAAVSSLAGQIEDGRVPGVRIARDGTVLRLYPAA